MKYVKSTLFLLFFGKLFAVAEDNNKNMQLCDNFKSGIVLENKTNQDLKIQEINFPENFYICNFKRPEIGSIIKQGEDFSVFLKFKSEMQVKQSYKNAFVLITDNNKTITCDFAISDLCNNGIFLVDSSYYRIISVYSNSYKETLLHGCAEKHTNYDNLNCLPPCLIF